mmetsp:Transcript_24508/g.35133  ORF Transcript_24508/g.35133 Transcript_24508/m.35133 type:complete len:467 (+) Transcript_24508:55-1455(+)
MDFSGYQQHTVLLTNLPEHLCDIRSLREVVGICGTSRFATISGSTGLVRMMTATGVSNVIRNFPCAVEGGARAYAVQKNRLLSSYTILGNSGNITRNASAMTVTQDLHQDSEVGGEHRQQQLPHERPMVRKLIDASRRLEERHLQLLATGNESAIESSTGSFAANSNPENQNEKPEEVKTNADVAADDEEGDPLNSPQVLEAVKNFKAALEAREGDFKIKRKRMVDNMLAERTQHHRQRLLTERKQQHDAQYLPIAPVAPPPPPPLPLSVISETDNVNSTAVKDSGRRGVSNLPSWMTSTSENDKLVEEEETLDREEKKQKYESEDSISDNVGHRRRVKLNVEGILSHKRDEKILESKWDQSTVESLSKEELFATPIFWDDQLHTLGTSFAQSLRKWVAEKIVEYLGEEETTLIDFVMDHVCNKRCAPQLILEEMELVLDEAAEDFVIQLWCILLVPSSLFGSNNS